MALPLCAPTGPRPPHFTPILARTQTVHTAIDPIAYDCVKVIVVRAGATVVFSEFGALRTVYLGAAIGSAGGGIFMPISAVTTPLAASLAGALAVLVVLTGAKRKPQQRRSTSDS